MTITKQNIIDVREAQDLATYDHAVLIDVRGFDEYAAGHPDGARCIPLPDLERRAGEIPTSTPVLVICQSGGRSSMAAERLRCLGFDNVIDVDGGFDAWTKAGLPTVEQAGVIPLERQVRGIAGFLVFGFTLTGILSSHWFFAGSLFVGFMLLLSGVTGLCPMISILRLMPWNRSLISNTAR